MCINVEKQIAKLRSRLEKADNRCQKACARYLDATSNLFDWAGQRVLTEPPASNFSFVTSFYKREDVLRRVYPGEWLPSYYAAVTESTWDKLDRLECRILDAWDNYNGVLWELQELERYQPSLI